MNDGKTFQSKTNPQLTLKYANGKLWFIDAGTTEEEFCEVEFLHAGSEEYNEAVIAEIQDQFQIKIVLQYGVFDYKIIKLS